MMKRFFIVLIGCLLSYTLVGQKHWTKHPDNPVMVNGSNGEWDENLDYIGSVIFSDDTYMMWYSALSGSNIRAVGLATSENGITWTRNANNPVFKVGPEGSWDQDYVSCGDVTMINNTFHMWYTGHKGGWDNSAIGHAISTDGINWTRDPENPVLTLEMEGSIDNGWIWIDEVVYDGDHLHMWYEAADMDRQEGLVGHATSIDGSQWTIDPSNPAILPGNQEDWDYPVVGFTAVVYDGSIFHMWYAGGNNYPSHIYDIGYATSTDGSNWDKYAGNPVMVKGSEGSWDAKSVFAPNVIDSAGSKYKMWYNGRPPTGSYNAKFGYAESSPYVEIPDTAFLYALIDAEVDTDGDSVISYAEAEAVTSLDVSGYSDDPGDITDMTGIEAFINLNTLYCDQNHLTNLDVAINTALSELYCSGNQLTSLDVSGNSSLEILSCVDNALTNLDLSNNQFLLFLRCGGNQLSSLDISNNTLLGSIFQLSIMLDLSNMPSLYEVCVWTTPFPPEGLEFLLDTTGSPNICFQTDCNGDCSIVGIEEVNQCEISIYPNPTYSLINIQTGISCPHHIEITSLNGQLIFSKEMEGTTRQLDLSSFRKGIYIITIKSKDFVTTRKIVKL